MVRWTVPQIEAKNVEDNVEFYLLNPGLKVNFPLNNWIQDTICG